MPSGIAYLSQGRLFFRSEDGASQEVDSPFAQSIRQRAFELHKRHAWKTQGRGAKFMSGAGLWGSESADPFAMPITLCGCACATNGDLYYSLQTPEISGLLCLKRESKAELRLLHTSDFRVGHIAVQRDTNRLALSLQHRGSATIAIMQADGGAFTEVTQGEAFDETPQWFPNGENRILFQSAGLAQNQQGLYVGKGPAVIQALDFDSGTMECLAEDANFDFLAPQIASDGALYFIRRPYRGVRPRFNPLVLLEDILLFPFRLIFALFQYLNLLTMMYTGKPLARSGNAQQRFADISRMTVWGNLIEARKSLLKGDDDARSLVPANWELCRKTKDGNIEVLAKGVLSFDLEPNGSLIYSNGSAVFRRDATGKTSRLEKAGMINQVISVPAATAEAATGDDVPSTPAAPTLAR